MSYTYNVVDGSSPEFKDIHIFCGKSAYQEAVEVLGYKGTEKEWLLSLKQLRFGKLEDFEETSDELIYIDRVSNNIYRYDSETQEYVAIGGVLGETADTAYRGDRGKIAYEHSQTDHDFVHRTKDTTVEGVVTFSKDIIGNISTASKLKAAQEITVGATKKTFDGSGGLVWTLDEIGVLNEEDVRKMFSELIGMAPETLDTFQEIATALGNDPNFATTVFTELSKMLPLAGGTMTGTINSCHVIPGTNNAYNLGSLINSWANIFSIKYSLTRHIDGISINIGEISANQASTSNISTKLILGNQKVIGTDIGAAKGELVLYQTGVYNTLLQAAAGNANYTITLPAANGTVALTSHTHPVMTAATASAAGTAGLVPAPAANKHSLFLRGDATWATPTDTKVTQNNCTTNQNYRVLLSANANDTDETNSTWKSSKLLFNPSTGRLTTKYLTSTDLGVAYIDFIGMGTSAGNGGLLDFHFNNSSADYTSRIIESASGKLELIASAGVHCSATLTATKVYNAVFNDYAEWYEKQDTEESFEPGDILIWDDSGVKKSDKFADSRVIGVYSDSYGHILGGEKLDNMEDNNKTHVPIGLSGRVDVKVVGKIKPGDLITTSHIPGIGVKVDSTIAKVGTIIGKAIKPKNTEEVGKVKIQIMLS